MTLVKSDWVTTAVGGTGIVKRVSKNGLWADVQWKNGMNGIPYTKRMPVTSLIVQTTIAIAEGWVVTDVTREKEVKKQKWSPEDREVLQDGDYSDARGFYI